jgi:V/A-type H+-transporting ATPase subunit I
VAVERMEMLNIIGPLDYLDDISREIALLGCIHIVNAHNEIDNNSFTISTTEKNIDALVDICFIKPYRKTVDYSEAAKRINRLMKAFHIKPAVDRSHIEQPFDFQHTMEEIDNIYNEVESCYNRIEQYEKDLETMAAQREYLSYIEHLDIDLKALNDLEFFTFRLGKLSKENMSKLKKNFDNVPAIVYKVHSTQTEDVVISIAPKSLKVELGRVFSSLGYQEIELPKDFAGTPRNCIGNLNARADQIQQEIRKLKKDLNNLKKKYGYYVKQSYSQLKISEKVQDINSETACSKEFFYLAGWIPVKQKVELEKRLKPYIEKTLLVFKDRRDVGKNVIPPTKLSNNPLVKPFESLVYMYGVPSYDEVDPTPFLGISYMLMFGAMFGDLGQGLVLLIMGLLLAHKKPRSNMGGVLSRLGISSMIFGILYGSVFGFEDVIPALLIRPMESIQTMLIAGIVLGSLLLTAGYVYNMINSLRQGDIEEGVFSRNGIVGLVFFWLILIAAASVFLNKAMPMPIPVLITILAVLLGLTVVKHPLANLITKRYPLYSESKADYYIEGGFGVIETLLSLLSNTISFIRVGAFALSHVSLFVAFLTMADMMSSNAGSIALLILGNVVVIALEGLIVFIQGLRLEYYEIFSKFYRGDGLPYKPTRISFAKKSDTR